MAMRVHSKAEALSKHPEQQPGEVLLTNCSSDEPDEFANIDYQTKEAGLVAYDENYRTIPYWFPVFVSTAEYNKVMGDVNKVEIGH